MDIVLVGVVEMDVHVLNDLGELIVYRGNLDTFTSADHFRFWADTRVYRYGRYYVANWIAYLYMMGHTVNGDQEVQALEHHGILVGGTAWPDTRAIIRWVRLSDNVMVPFENHHWAALPYSAARIYVTPGLNPPAIPQLGP